MCLPQIEDEVFCEDRAADPISQMLSMPPRVTIKMQVQGPAQTQQQIASWSDRKNHKSNGNDNDRDIRAWQTESRERFWFASVTNCLT